MGVLTAGCSRSDQASETKAGGNRVGEYRGYGAINQIIRTRFFESKDSSQSFFLGRYVDMYSDAFEGLPVLLGGFSGEGLQNDLGAVVFLQ